MERYTVHGLTGLNRDDHAGRIEAYLRAQGIDTAGVVVRWDDLDRVTVTVTAAADPAKALGSYTPTLTPEEAERAAILADAQAALAEIAGKDPRQRSALERAMLGLARENAAVAAAIDGE